MLCRIGGFDEAYHYFLEDADVNLRLQEFGFKTAIVPTAEIIHNYRESRGRGSNRVPKSLYNLGASTHHFLRQHARKERLQDLDRFYTDQESRLINFFHLGLIRPKQIKGLMRDLRRGIDAGADREKRTPLQPINGKRLSKLLLRDLKFTTSFQEPSGASNSGIPVHLRMIPTVHAARLTFRRKGYWRMTFGRFGRLSRNDPWWRYRKKSTAITRIETFLEPRLSRTTSDKL